MLPEKRKKLIIGAISVVVIIIVVILLGKISSFIKNRNDENTQRNDDYSKMYDYIGVTIDEDNIYKIYGISVYDEDNIKKNIQEAKKMADFVIVDIHWGKGEASFGVTTQMEEMAKFVIESGADLVMGTHAIGIQPISTYNGKPIIYTTGYAMTDLEYEILDYLLLNRKQVISASQLFEAIWHENYYYGANNTIMVHIRNLRKKIEDDPQNPRIIKTVWGKGYYID